MIPHSLSTIAGCHFIVCSVALATDTLIAPFMQCARGQRRPDTAIPFNRNESVYKAIQIKRIHYHRVCAPCNHACVQCAEIIRISYYVSAKFFSLFHQRASNDERWASTMAYDIYLIIRIIIFMKSIAMRLTLCNVLRLFFPSFVHLLTWHLMLMMLIGKHVNVSVYVRAQRNGVCVSSRLTIGMDSRVHQPANGKHEFKLSFTQMQNSRKSKRNKTVKQRDASSFLACKLKIAMAWRNFTVWWLACNTRRLIAIDMVF